MLEKNKKKGILIRSRQEFFEEDIDNIKNYILQEFIAVVYNFYADLYKGQNIGLDEIKDVIYILFKKFLP
jgi:hypothetical protein